MSKSLPPSLSLPDHLELKDISLKGEYKRDVSTPVAVDVYVRGSLKCTGKPFPITQELLDKEEDDFLNKFVQEIKLHSLQVHPNVVQLLGVYYETELVLEPPLIITEYLPMTLTDCLQKYDDIPDWIKIQFMLDISHGMSYLHGHKDHPIIHFNLTSDTILLTKHCEAKIADLSISRLNFNSPTNLLNYVFMPPEFLLADNTSYTTKFDIFSFGCICVHVLSQQYPIPSEQYVFSSSPNSINSETCSTMNESTDNILLHDLTLVSEWNRRSNYLSSRSSSDLLVTLAEKCLSNDSSDRPLAIDIVSSLEAEELPYDEGGVFAMINELQEKDKELQKSVQVFKRKTKDFQAILDAKEATNVRLHTQLKAKDKNLEGENGTLSKLNKDNAQLKSENSELQEKAQRLEDRIIELEKETQVQSAVTIALENVKQEQNTKITQLSQSLTEKIEMNETLQSQLDFEMKEKVESYQALSVESERSCDLNQQLKVMKENESRMESIMYNQQAQLEGLLQSVNISRATQTNLEKTITELQFLQTSILDEQNELSDKYQCDVMALTELNKFYQLKLQIQQIEMQKLMKQTASLKTALYDANVSLRDQQQLTDQLLKRQENELVLAGLIRIAPPVFQQKKIVHSLLKQKYVEGDSWCLVSMDWFDKWEKYIAKAIRDGIENATEPGPVTNFMLMKNISFRTSDLKEKLVKDLEYKLIPEICWDLLIQWYGLSEKSLRISRNVVKVKKNTITMYVVEIYPLIVHVRLADSTEQMITNYQISRGDKIVFILEKLKKHFQVPDETQVRLWVQNTHQKVLLMETDTIGNNSASFSVKDENTLILDLKKDDVWIIKETPAENEKYYYVTRSPRAPLRILSNSEYEDMN